MILKPETCKGCPFYDHGAYFTPDTMVEGSTVTFIGQNPGENEQAGHKIIASYGGHNDQYAQVAPQPLIGRTGALFNWQFLPLTGLTRPQVSVANAIRCRPGTSFGLEPDGLPPITRVIMKEALAHCNAAHLHLPASTRLIVTMGTPALYQQTGLNSATEWRGYVLGKDKNNYIYGVNDYYNMEESLHILPMLHIAALFKGENKKYYNATRQDFHKVLRILKGEWPLPLPIWSEAPPKTWPDYSAFDTEYTIDAQKLIRWSMADLENNLYCIEAVDGASTIPIKPRSTVLLQNALADIHHLSTLVDISSVQIEDLMLAHSVLFTGEPHRLDYLCSIYGAFNRYKHIGESQPQLYSALDAYEPLYIWRTAMIPEFKADPGSLGACIRAIECH